MPFKQQFRMTFELPELRVVDSEATTIGSESLLVADINIYTNIRTVMSRY